MLNPPCLCEFDHSHTSSAWALQGTTYVNVRQPASYMGHTHGKRGGCHFTNLFESIIFGCCFEHTKKTSEMLTHLAQGTENPAIRLSRGILYAKYSVKSPRLPSFGSKFFQRHLDYRPNPLAANCRKHLSFRELRNMFAMRCLVSLSVLAIALHVIYSDRYTGENRKWAYGTVGYLLGYWLNA